MITSIAAVGFALLLVGIVIGGLYGLWRSIRWRRRQTIIARREKERHRTLASVVAEQIIFWWAFSDSEEAFKDLG